MGKFLDGVEYYDKKIKSPIQYVICIILIGALIGSFILFILYGPSSCSNEISYLNNFINDTVDIHNGNYQVIVTNAITINQIEILKNENDTEKTIMEGNFIKIDLTLTQDINSDLKLHKLDCDDFKLKDHNGVYIPLNDIMSIVDINAVDMHLLFDKNGAIISNANFSTKKAIKDYEWFNKEITAGYTTDLSIIFEMTEGYKVEENIMILEIDFYSNIVSNKTKNGTDIILAIRVDN